MNRHELNEAAKPLTERVGAVDPSGYLIRLDKAAFYDELLEGFICREYVDRFGPMEWDFKEKAIERYRNDPIFYNRVQQVTGHIMMMLGKHKR